MADGEAVDWAEVERRLAGLPEAKQAAGLRLIQSLAEDRWVSPASGAGAGAVGEARAWKGSTIGLRLVLAVASLRVVCELFGLVRSLLEPAAAQAGLLATLLCPLVYIGVGVVLARAARQDSRALSLAGFFLIIASSASLYFQSPLGNILSGWPAVLSLHLFLPEAFLPFLLWSFTREFPRVLRLDRWAPLVQVAVQTSGALGLVLFSVNVFAQLAGVGSLSYWGLLYFANSGLFLLCLPISFVAWRRSRQASDDERRRVRWFFSGLAFWWLPWGGYWFLPMKAINNSQLGPLMGYLQLLTVSLMTYAVIARRLPDVRQPLRNAARLALSRGAALGLAMLLTGLLLLRLFEQHHYSILAVAANNQIPIFFAVLFWTYYLLHGKAEKVPVGRRKDPALALALASFSRDAQNARTIGELERLVQERFDDLVSPLSSVLLLRDPARSSYAAIASGPRPLAASSSLVRLAEEVSPELFSLSVEDRGSLLGLLTAEDRHWITEADPELIVPLSSARGETVALFVLGPKRSGLPYTRDEQQAVTALTAAASLALENVAGLGDRAWGLDAAEEPAGECRRCGHVALRAEGFCACKRLLAPAAMPYELAGKFRLERVLGEGGMGVVYRATDLTLGRQVALKTLPRLGSEALQRLRREARSMAGFLHPNLALIFGAETWRGVPILVVEYLAGGSLASRLGEPMAPREVLRLGMDLAGALEAMHAKGLLHRDVKPSNIGFTGGGVPKLLDFGLARLHEEAHFEVPVLDPGLSVIADEKLRLTLTGQVVGTPLYMAPEALAGALPSPAHDLWSLHLVLWEALAGRHPFAGMSLEAAVHRMAREEIPDIRTARPDCPAEISSLLVRALHLNAHHRPATAGAVREAFLGAGWTA